MSSSSPPPTLPPTASASHAVGGSRAALWLWGVLLTLCLVVIARTPFKADLSAFLPAAPNAQQRLLIEQLQAGAPARSLMLALEGGTPAGRVAGARQLAEGLRRSGQFEWVREGDRSGFDELGPWVFENRYALSPAVAPQRFTAAGLSEGIDDSLALLGTPAGTALKPLLPRDPTGETLRIAEAQMGAEGPRSHQGVWVSRDGKQALLMTSLRAAAADMDAQAAALQTVQAEFARLPQAGSLKLVVSGSPRFAVESRAQIQQEVKALAISGTVLLVGLLWLAFGSLRVVAVAAVPVLTGVAAGVAMVSLVFGQVHGITLGFGTTLIGEAVDYAIYYFLQAGGSAADVQRRWRDHGWPTVRLGLLTSVCGFGALAFSGFPGLAQLGVFSLAGLVAAALTTRFVLPVLSPGTLGGQPMRRRLGALAGWLAHTLPRWRPAVWLAAAACLALLALQEKTLWGADLTALSPVSRQALAQDAALREELAVGDGGTFLVVQAADAQATLVAAEAAGQALDALVAAGQLQGYESPTRLLPSLATQAARRASLPEPAALQAALTQATAGGPLPAARLGPFLQDVERARQAEPLTLKTLPPAAASLVQALFMAQADGRWTAILPLRAAPGVPLSEAVLAPVLKAAPGVVGVANAASAPSVQWLDVGAQLRQLYQHYLAQAKGQALWGAAGVVLLMALWLRSPRRLLAVCQPLVLALIFTLTALSLLNVQLGILHLLGLLLVVAVGSNYALFFDMLRHEGEQDSDTLASLALANLTTVLSFGLIAFSSIPALADIGRVVAPGAFLALLLSAACVLPPSPASARKG